MTVKTIASRAVRAHARGIELMKLGRMMPRTRPVRRVSRRRSGRPWFRSRRACWWPVASVGTVSDTALTCQQALQRMGRALANELHGVDWLAFRSHLRNCPGCHDRYLALELRVFLDCEAAVGIP